MAPNETSSLQIFQNQKTHDQHSSLFFRLPPEIRDAVYLALVENAGFSQHIILHEDAEENNSGQDKPPRFCSWPCTTEYDVEGNDNPHGLNNGCQKSRWHNHWRCESAMLQACAGEGQVDGPCRARRTPTGYLPMMLACRRMYWELSPVIYANTRFVFTDVVTYQMFMGVCPGEADSDSNEEEQEEQHVAQREEPHNPPPQFMQHTRELDLSMSMEFPMQMPCSAELEAEVEAGLGKHSAYDFHWLQLDKLASCRKVNLWIAFDRPPHCMFYGRYITDKSPNFLRKSLMAFEPADHVQVTLSTPLSFYVGPLQACGAVDELSRPNVRVWKRDNYVVDISPTDDIGISCTLG